MPRPEQRRRVPFSATVYVPQPGGQPDPRREVWVWVHGHYQAEDLARAYACAERLRRGVVVVDVQSRTGPRRHPFFLDNGYPAYYPPSAEMWDRHGLRALVPLDRPASRGVVVGGGPVCFPHAPPLEAPGSVSPRAPAGPGPGARPDGPA